MAQLGHKSFAKCFSGYITMAKSMKHEFEGLEEFYYMAISIAQYKTDENLKLVTEVEHGGG